MSLSSQITRFFSQTFPFLFPVLILLYPVIYINYLDQLNWAYLACLYFFILTNQFIENHLTNQEMTQRKTPVFSNLFLEVLNLGLIVFIAIQYSKRLSLLLLAYSALIHIQFGFVRYRCSMLALILLALFKAFVLPISLFQLHLDFLTLQLFLYPTSFLIPIFMLDYDRFARKLNRDNILNPSFNQNWQKKIIQTGTLLSILISILILWPSLSAWSLTMLLAPLLIFWISTQQSLENKERVRLYFTFYMVLFNVLCLIYYQYLA